MGKEGGKRYPFFLPHKHREKDFGKDTLFEPNFFFLHDLTTFQPEREGEKNERKREGEKEREGERK